LTQSIAPYSIQCSSTAFLRADNAVATLRFNAAKHFDDAREMPAYSIPLAAQYLQLPPATLRSWVLGRAYPTDAGPQWFEPVIPLSDPSTKLLSFFNLAEAHVLSAFRKDKKIRLDHVRTALDYVTKEFATKHPLIDHAFETDGAKLFVRKLEQLVDASARGQIVMPQVMAHLERLERENATVTRLYPFTRPGQTGPRSVFIDPRFSFGKPVLADSGIPTASIAGRYKAGESINDLAADFRCPPSEIEEAVRCELQQAA
jgi:uncharacterized protein (DUF433 family)